MKILLKIRYRGEDFCGFQCQKNGNAVQNVLTCASNKVFGFPCMVTGCSRTDSGVHAMGFCATVEPCSDNKNDWCSIPIEKIHRAYSPYLPDGVSVVAAAEVADDFHPRYSSKGKQYRYRIWDAPYENPFEKGRSMRNTFRINNLSLEKMQNAANFFCGEHDFKSFMASGSKIVDTKRTVFKAEVFRENPEVVAFTVSADGFLYNMVRIMAGTLVEVAAGKIDPCRIPEIIESEDRNNAGITAPAEGLYLESVFYEDTINWRCD